MVARVYRALLAVLPLALLAGPAPAQDDAGRVKVHFPFDRALGVTGEPVQGLTLRLVRHGSGEAVEAVTGADGSFAFENLEPGLYRFHLAPPEGKAPDKTISLAIPGAASGETRRKKPREIVVVGLADRDPPAGGRIPAHTPEWTDLSDHDPGVVEGDKGHGDWIELVSASATEDGNALVLTIAAAWEVAGADAYFDLRVGSDASATAAVRGGVVFGDGISGRRPPRAKPAVPAVGAEPAGRPRGMPPDG